MTDERPSVHWTDDQIRFYANSQNERGLEKYIVEFYDQLIPSEPDFAEVDFGKSRLVSGATVRRFKREVLA